MNIRPIAESDHEAIRNHLTQAVNKAGKEWITTVDLPTALHRILSGELQGFIVEETYLLVADVTTPWYSAPDTKILSELLVLRIGNGPGKFQDIPRALRLLAGVVGAGAIVVGTALARESRALRRMYERDGFRSNAEELYLNLKE